MTVRRLWYLYNFIRVYTYSKIKRTGLEEECMAVMACIWNVPQLTVCTPSPQLVTMKVAEALRSGPGWREKLALPAKATVEFLSVLLLIMRKVLWPVML